MESAIFLEHSKRDIKIRPIVIHKYKKNIPTNIYSYSKFMSHRINKPQKEFQYHKRIIKKTYSNANRPEFQSTYGTIHSSIETKNQLQVQIFHNKKGENKSNGGKQSSSNKTKLPVNVNALDFLFPLIIQGAPIQVIPKFKQITMGVQPPSNNFPGLPRTASYVPYVKNNPIFVPCECYLEKTYCDNDRQLIEELMLMELPKVPRRIVYDMYQISPYTNNVLDYKSFYTFNSDTINIDPSLESYSLICIGRGSPTRYFPNKVIYQDNLIPYYIPSTAEDDTLIFESRFESGNLRRAIQVYIKVEV